MVHVQAATATTGIKHNKGDNHFDTIPAHWFGKTGLDINKTSTYNLNVARMPDL